MDFQGRVAIVTGGSGALGSAVALDLAQHGARVVVPVTSEEHWVAVESRAGAAKLVDSELNKAVKGSGFGRPFLFPLHRALTLWRVEHSHPLPFRRNKYFF